MASGSSNGLATKGGVGGLAPTGEPRSALAALTRAVEAGQQVDDSDLAANIKFARSVRDSEETTIRDKMRATEYLDSLIARGINVAMYLDGRDRPAAPPVQVAVGVQVNIRPAVAP